MINLTAEIKVQDPNKKYYGLVPIKDSKLDEFLHPAKILSDFSNLISKDLSKEDLKCLYFGYRKPNPQIMDLPSRNVYLFQNCGKYIALELYCVGYPQNYIGIDQMMICNDLEKAKKFLEIENLENNFESFYPNVGTMMK